MRPALALIVLAACARLERTADFHPVYREQPTLGEPGREVDVFHPFYERRETPDARTVQVRPFYWKRTTAEEERVHVLGPFARWADDGRLQRLTILPFVHYSARTSPERLRSWWFVLFPVLFLGNDDLLVFPVAGYSRGLLGLDKLVLVTPLYARTRQRDFVAHHVLFPFVSWGSDGKPGGRRRFRIAPFFGKSRARDGTRSGFVMWPFYTWARRGDELDAQFFFPFYGHRTTPTSREITVLFPFFHKKRDHLTGHVDTALWPFWRRADGGDRVYVRRKWPFHEYRREAYGTTEYVMWPIWRREYVDDRRDFGKVTWVMPFYRRAEYVRKDDGRSSRKSILWPLARWERREDGAREVMVPNLLPADAPVLREMFEPFRPFISLYRRETAPDGERETSVLFGLVQSRRTFEGSSFKVPLLYSRRTDNRGPRHVRILTGLFGWGRNRDGDGYVRLLWGIRIGPGSSE